MEKKLTATAMLFSIGFVFMLVLAVGTFFYGLKLGTEKTEAKYALAAEKEKEKDANASPYQQQDLVSFYHTVFLPYREFQNEWFAGMNKISQGQTTEVKSLFKNLSAIAEKKATEASSVSMQTSPLLQQAQEDYIRSLNLFRDASSKLASSTEKKSAAEIMSAVEQEPSYASARQFSLSAQQEYYHAMMKWGSSIDPDIPAEYTAAATLDVNQWTSLPLIVKNKVISDQLKEYKQITVYYPHDLTSKVDDLIQSGQAAKLKLQTLHAVVELLVNTEAVRPGDFLDNKVRLYQQAVLPQLPFFSAQSN